jgi:hypothetical protein
MTTRRALLWTAGVGLAATATGCDSRERATPPAVGGPNAAQLSGELLVALVGTGLAVLDTAGRSVLPASPGLLAPGTARLIRTARRPGGTELAGHDVRDGQGGWRATLAGDARPRAVSADGRLVALVVAPTGDDAPPGWEGDAAYRPVGRERTTIVIADQRGERLRVDLPGNLEPEAFSADGRHLFVLDYRPPTAPDRYRVRMLDLSTRALGPLSTRAKSVVPAGAEEEMRGQGRQAVYDESRRLLFTLYTHQPEHLHTRDLLRGARPEAAHVHAFVHTLNLAEHWAYCVDLPAPFGEQPAAKHAIAYGAPDRLAVVDAGTGAVARLDPDALTVTGTTRFTPLGGGAGDAVARFTADGSLLVAGGREVLRLADGRTRTRWTCASGVRGLVPHPDGTRVYVGQDGAVACHDVATGRLLSHTPVAGLTSLRDLIPAVR